MAPLRICLFKLGKRRQGLWRKLSKQCGVLSFAALTAECCWRMASLRRWGHSATVLTGKSQGRLPRERLAARPWIGHLCGS